MARLGSRIEGLIDSTKPPIAASKRAGVVGVALAAAMLLLAVGAAAILALNTG